MVCGFKSEARARAPVVFCAGGHMKSKILILGGALMIAPFLSASLWAEPTLDDLSLGDHWMGEKWDRESLRERTVVVEMWGYN